MKSIPLLCKRSEAYNVSKTIIGQDRQIKRSRGSASVFRKDPFTGHSGKHYNNYLFDELRTAGPQEGAHMIGYN